MAQPLVETFRDYCLQRKWFNTYVSAWPSHFQELFRQSEAYISADLAREEEVKAVVISLRDDVQRYYDKKRLQRLWIQRYAGDLPHQYQDRFKQCEAYLSGDSAREQELPAVVDSIREEMARNEEKKRVQEDWLVRYGILKWPTEFQEQLRQSDPFVAGDLSREVELKVVVNNIRQHQNEQIHQEWIARYAAEWPEEFQEQLRESAPFVSGDPAREDELREVVEVINAEVESYREIMCVQDEVLKNLSEDWRLMRRVVNFLSGDSN